MFRRALVLAFTCALASSLHAQDPAAPTAARKRVLVYTVSAGYEHDVVKRAKPDEPSLVERTLVDLGLKRGWFECVLSRDAADFTPEKLAAFDMVFFYTTGELPFSAANQRALFDFVKQGKAFAGAHCATDTFYKVPEYGEMVGAYFDGHPWHEKVSVLVDDREHPATKHLGASFEITDEIYQFKAPYDRAKLHVLLRLDPDALDLSRQGVNRKDKDFANAWCKDFGKGRVFYTALGHGPDVWKDERFLTHLEGGFAWAMHAESRVAADAATMKQGDKPGEKRAPAPKQGGAHSASAGGAGEASAVNEDAASRVGAPSAANRDAVRATPSSASGPPGAQASAPAPAHTTAKPVVPPGFAVDLVTEAPEILWPTAIACQDDGTLLVGEDRMDMPGPTDQPLDRLIALHFHDDGTITKTVFADTLFAVMGVEIVDDAVYVMNMPHLTRLRDTDEDGIADERTEVLTDLGPKAPGFPGGFNDHIVSGVRLGIDGFLYISVGDKGIPHAHGTDGSELTLRGGGVIRVRPDGSRLEIVATGLRNVLDVAMDERGEMFTYDNTDDGLGWWTRLTHIVPGGYYGYPWDYKSHPERMLPCMAEYGGGSPCGGLVYREAAWPQEFRGNLFYCEWGKGMLRRFVLEPKGATFGVKTADDFMTAGDVSPFKPFDVCESPDGRFLYVSDWAYEGWTAKNEAGRVWRVRRADDDARAPSRLAPMKDPLSELSAAGWRSRLRSQRSFMSAGSSSTVALRSVVDHSPDSRARRHALWALAQTAGTDVITPGTDVDKDDLVDWCRAAASFPERVEPNVFALMYEQDPKLFLAAANTAATWIDRWSLHAGDTELKERRNLGGLMGCLGDGFRPHGDTWTNTLVLMLQRKASVTPILSSLQGDFDPNFPEPIEIRVLPAFRERFELYAVGVLESALISSRGPLGRAAVVEALASNARMQRPWDGKWWNIQPAKTPRPVGSVDWEKTAEVLGTLRGALGDRDATVRSAALTAVRDLADREALPLVRARLEHETDLPLRMQTLDLLGALKDVDAAPVLERVVRDPALSSEERQHAIDAACAIRSKEMLELLRSIVVDEKAPSEHVVACIDALARIKDVESVPVIEKRARVGDGATRGAAMKALARIQGKEAGPVIAAQLTDVSKDVRIAACRALADANDARQVTALLPLASASETTAEATLALARMPDVRALSVFLAGVEASEKRVVDASHAALLALRDDARSELETLHRAGKLDEKQLAAVQQAFRSPQPVTSWQLLGPFERIGAHPLVLERGVENAKTSSTIDSTHPDLAARFVGREKAEFTWREAHASTKTGFVDLRDVFQGFDEVTAFAFARVTSSSKRKAELRVGSDDMVKVWLNGVRVHSSDAYRAWTEDQDEVDVELQAGENALLVEVDNGGGGWSFDVKLSGDESGPLFERKSLAPGLEDYRAFALANKGDPRHGYELFRLPSGPMCARCHTVFGEGGKVGPDLSDVAAKYSRDEILNSILVPSQRIAEGYEAMAFELTNGLAVFGQIQKETHDTVVIFDTNGETKTIDTADIETRTRSKTSIMPDGLAALIGKQDFADLVAYVLTLRGAPK